MRGSSAISPQRPPHPRHAVRLGSRVLADLLPGGQAGLQEIDILAGTPQSWREPIGVTTAGRTALIPEIWRHGTKSGPDNPTAVMSSRFTARRIRPASRHITRNPDGSLPEGRLLAE
ncbi:hypothetical protein AB0E01_39145 [Nocardia vinacea]|uniref:hypothetical protein n=1 Tax=Nocardia vinacea TaxID=96468 RepID=UPI0033CDE562